MDIMGRSIKPSTMTVAAANIVIAGLCWVLWIAIVAISRVLMGDSSSGENPVIRLLVLLLLPVIPPLGLAYWLWNRLARRLLPAGSSPNQRRIARLGFVTTATWLVLLIAWVVWAVLVGLGALRPGGNIGIERSLNIGTLAGILGAAGFLVTLATSHLAVMHIDDVPANQEVE